MKNDHMKSSMNKKCKFKFPLFPSKKGKDREAKEDAYVLSEKINVNETYKEIFRTKSYTEMWSKVHFQFKGSTPSSSSSPFSLSQSSSSLSHSSNSTLPFYMHIADTLLEPSQEVINDVIKSSHIQSLLIDYFEASLEAGNICELLLQGIYKTRSNYQLIKRVNDQCQDKVMQNLDSFTRLKNPLSIINGKVNFGNIHIKYTNLFQKLILKRRKIKQREKFTRYCKKVVRYGFMITYAAFTITIITLAMHSMVGLLGLPGLLIAFPIEVVNKVKVDKNNKVNFLKCLASQLDVAARGIYILINGFDTIGRLTRRLYDEFEHTNAMAEICVKNKKSHEVIKEALRELHLDEDGFIEQLEELEEQINLCFLTINRSRKLVIQEILSAGL